MLVTLFILYRLMDSTPTDDFPPGNKWIDMIILYIWEQDREQPGIQVGWEIR